MRWLIILVLLFLPVVARATDCCVKTQLKVQAFGKGAKKFVTNCQVITINQAQKQPPCASGEELTKCETTPTLEDPDKHCEQAMIAGGFRGVAPQPPEFKIAKPRLQIPLFTLKPFTGSFTTFKEPLEIMEGEKRFLVIDTLATYLVALYQTLVGISGIIAGIMIVWAGVKWMTAAGNPERITDARKKIAGAIVGVVLMLGSYVILNIINPQLVFFKPLRVQLIERETLEFDTGDIIEEGAPFPAEITKPTWNYQTFDCANPPPPAGVAPANAMVTFSCPKGVSGSITALPEMKNALCQAGARALDYGYTLQVTSSYRPFARQVEIWCGTGQDKVCFNNNPNPKKRKKACAVPGFSNHGHGRAIDVKLIKDGKSLITMGFKKQCQDLPASAETIARIFYEADPGWTRYEQEIWHFEFNSTMPGRGPFFGLPNHCKK